MKHCREQLSFELPSVTLARRTDKFLQVTLIQCDNTVLYKSSATADMGDPLATIDMGRKVGVLLCPFPWGNWVPSNTMSPGRRPTSVPSGMLIHQTVWPQYTNVTDIVAPISAVGRLVLQAQQPGIRCQTIFVIRRLAKTLLGDY